MKKPELLFFLLLFLPLIYITINHSNLWQKLKCDVKDEVLRYTIVGENDREYLLLQDNGLKQLRNKDNYPPSNCVKAPKKIKMLSGYEYLSWYLQ